MINFTRHELKNTESLTVKQMRFRNTPSPVTVTIAAYSYVGVIAIALYATGFYENSTFFAWGPPIKFFNREVSSTKEFYYLHALIFGHQLVNNCVSSVVYPWIINNVQDPKSKVLLYSTPVTLLLINAFDIYSEIDVVFIIGGFTSQISFVATIICANLITSTFINYKYVKDRETVNEPLMPHTLNHAVY